MSETSAESIRKAQDRSAQEYTAREFEEQGLITSERAIAYAKDPDRTKDEVETQITELKGTMIPGKDTDEKKILLGKLTEILLDRNSKEDWRKLDEIESVQRELDQAFPAGGHTDGMFETPVAQKPAENDSGEPGDMGVTDYRKAA